MRDEYWHLHCMQVQNDLRSRCRDGDPRFRFEIKRGFEYWHIEMTPERLRQLATLMETTANAKDIIVVMGRPHPNCCISSANFPTFKHFDVRD